jgi:hypothetical protein
MFSVQLPEELYKLAEPYLGNTTFRVEVEAVRESIEDIWKFNHASPNSQEYIEQLRVLRCLRDAGVKQRKSLKALLELLETIEPSAEISEDSIIEVAWFFIEDVKSQLQSP